jgi:hypothetical protein
VGYSWALDCADYFGKLGFNPVEPHGNFVDRLFVLLGRVAKMLHRLYRFEEFVYSGLRQDFWSLAKVFPARIERAFVSTSSLSSILLARRSFDASDSTRAFLTARGAAGLVFGLTVADMARSPGQDL